MYDSAFVEFYRINPMTAGLRQAILSRCPRNFIISTTTPRERAIQEFQDNGGANEFSKSKSKAATTALTE